MDRSQIKKEAKQKITSDFGKMLMPVWASILWGLIIGVILAVMILLFIFVPIIIIPVIVAIPITLAILFLLLNLSLKQAEFYLKVARGEPTPTLKLFFNFSGSMGKIWVLFKIRLMKTIFTFMLIFMPGYVSTMFCVDDFEVLDNDIKDSKVHFVKIPRLTKSHIFELALVKLSFFWWNLLTIVTLGIAGIFVSPYKNLTRAKIYEYLVDSYEKDEKIKKTFMQMAAGQTVSILQDENGVSKVDNDMTNNDSDSLFVDAQTKLFAQAKQDFASVEGELAEYIEFENNFSNVAQCQNSEQMLDMLQNYSGNMEYSRAKQFEKADCKVLKKLLKNYKALSSNLQSIEGEDNRRAYEKMLEIVSDRISVIELEIMQNQKYSVQTAYGGRVSKLKGLIKKSSEHSHSQRFGEACEAQLKVEKKSFAVMTSIILAVFLVCVVMPISVTLATAPFIAVTIDGIDYVKKVDEDGYFYSVVYVQEKKESLVIKDKVRGLPVRAISNYAFNGCSELTNITIPNSVTSIGSSAFKYCTGLTSITIPNSVTSINNAVFYNCSSLTSITIPDSVTSIGNSAFYGCSGLTSITIGNSVTSIGSSAFYGCKGLTNITIPNNVTSIGEKVFAGCNSLESISMPFVMPSGNKNFYWLFGEKNNNIPKSLKTVIITSGTSIINSAFYNCIGLTSITILDSVTSIGSSVFYGCTELTNITIPNSVTSIGSSAFYGCTGLTSVTIPDSVTSIDHHTFYNCNRLESITIPDRVTSIGSSAFNGCSGLEVIDFKGTMARWKNISKGSSWNYNTGDFTVICTDGKLDKIGNVIS